MNPKLAKSSFFNLPSLDHLPNPNYDTMKMINTVNAFPNQSSLDNI